jgi:hypothetical protein
MSIVTMLNSGVDQANTLDDSIDLDIETQIDSSRYFGLNMGVWGCCLHVGVEPLHPALNFMGIAIQHDLCCIFLVCRINMTEKCQLDQIHHNSSKFWERIRAASGAFVLISCSRCWSNKSIV